MPAPAPGTLNYIVHKRISTDIKFDEATVLITDGLSAKVVKEKVRKTANLSDIPHNLLVQLWDIGTIIDMKRWRVASQKRDDAIISNTVDGILRVLIGSATPSINAVFNAAQQVLIDANKLDDWSKLNTLLQAMDETQLRQFLAFIILITLSKSAAE